MIFVWLCQRRRHVMIIAKVCYLAVLVFGAFSRSLVRDAIFSHISSNLERIHHHRLCAWKDLPTRSVVLKIFDGPNFKMRFVRTVIQHNTWGFRRLQGGSGDVAGSPRFQERGKFPEGMVMFVTFLEAGPNLNFKKLELVNNFGGVSGFPRRVHFLEDWYENTSSRGLGGRVSPEAMEAILTSFAIPKYSTCVWFACWVAKLCFQSGGNKIGVMGASISSLISEAKCTRRAVKIKRACRDHPHFWAEPRHPHYDKFRKMLQAGFHCGRNVKSGLWPLPKVARNQKPVPHWKSIMEFRSHCSCGKKKPLRLYTDDLKDRISPVQHFYLGSRGGKFQTGSSRCFEFKNALTISVRWNLVHQASGEFPLVETVDNAFHLDSSTLHITDMFIKDAVCKECH